MLTASVHHHTDEELIVMLNKGKTLAIDIIYERYWRGLFTAALARTNDDEVAKDIVQTLLIELWQKREQLQVNTSLSQYLYGAVKLKVLHHYRSETIKQTVLENALQRMTEIAGNTADLADYFKLEKIVSEEVDIMPANMRRSFLLRNDSYSIKEIAESLNLAEQTVANNITEALRRLKRRINVEYPDRYVSIAGIFLLLFTKS